MARGLCTRGFGSFAVPCYGELKMTLIRLFGIGDRAHVLGPGKLKTSVTVALAAVQADILRLTRRNEQLRGWAADLLGTQDGSTFQREPEDEADLADAEHRLLAGSRRLAQLEETSQFLTSLKREIEAHVDSTAGAPAAIRQWRR